MLTFVKLMSTETVPLLNELKNFRYKALAKKIDLKYLLYKQKTMSYFILLYLIV